MLVYLIRHGQSEANLKRFVGGQLDVNLTPQGVTDAKKAGEILKGLHFDRIFSSDLSRAVETAKTAVPGCEPEQFKCIREIDTGRMAGQVIAEFDDEMKYIYSIKDFSKCGGESPDMQKKRVEEFKNMLESLKNCERVAVFTHEWVLYSMLRLTICDELPLHKIKFENGSVLVLEYSEKKWTLRKLTSYEV